MIKNLFNRQEPDPLTQNMRLDDVPSEAIHLAAEYITRSRDLCPEDKFYEGGIFNPGWFYELSPREQRQKLGEYFEALVRQDSMRQFGNYTYKSMCKDYENVQSGLRRSTAKDRQDRTF